MKHKLINPLNLLDIRSDIFLRDLLVVFSRIQYIFRNVFYFEVETNIMYLD